MAAPVAFSPFLKGKANQLAVMLNTEEKKGRKAWEDLHGKLADVATFIADPTTTIQALLNILKEIGSLVLGYPDAQVLLGQIMEHVEEKVSTQGAADASQAIPLLKTLILHVACELNMTPLRNSVHLDLIDGDSTLAEENADYMVNSSAELSAPNAPYAIVSIVGAQSSGKSYLLNQLFGTKFPVMDPKHGRSQTTRGILMSRCIEPSMLVLDIEGFDGRERGKDTLFENQAALFALIVSDLMMVNISVFDIGREHGCGESLFKTIFQERTKLPPCLTNIVVILRHYNGETPLEILRQDVMKTLEEMWRSVNKESTTFTHYIKITVFGLPDKASEEFQKEMLVARLYCQRTVEACMEKFDEDLLKAEESPQGFKNVSNTLLSYTISQYDRETELYDAMIRNKEQQKMVDQINKIFTEHSQELITKIQEDTSKQFKDEFARELENMDKDDDVLNYDDHKVELCVEEFSKLCEDLKEFDLEYFYNSCGELQKQLNSHTAVCILSLKDERARKAIQELQKSNKNIDALIMKLDERTEERLRLQDEIQREKENSRREQRTSEKRIEELIRKLDQRTGERLRREEEIRLERGK